MSTSTAWTDPTVDGTVEMPVSAELMGRTAPVWPATVISQYANSPRILALVQAFAAAVDPTRLIDAFVTNIWDIDTATSYGLDVWGRIINVRRGLYIPGGETGALFGFGEEGAGNVFTFGHAPFNTSSIQYFHILRYFYNARAVNYISGSSYMILPLRRRRFR